MRKPALQPTIAQLRRGYKNLAYPEPGWFKLKLIKRGPWVPAIIWQPCPWVEPEPGEPGDPEYWCCPTDPWRGPRWLLARIGDDDVDPLDVWVWGTRISRQEYLHMMAERAWARLYSPTDPVAQPRQPVDLSKQPSLF